jgi:LysR family nitrogen assimilation transcriptional regulator
MELAHIRSFLEVARLGSVTRAAQKLLLTQPAVTQHIQSLEREFRATLLDRTGRGVRMTAAGRALHRRFQESIACLDDARAAVHAADAGVTGHLTLGSAITLGSSGVAVCIARLRQQYPGISLTVRTARSEVVTSLVLDGQVDVGIAAVPRSTGSLRTTALYEQTFVLVAARNHPFAGREIGKQQAAALPMVGCSEGRWIGVESDFGCIRASATKVETDTLESIKGLVEAGLGCAFLPLHDVEKELSAGRLIRLRVRGVAMPARIVSLLQHKGVSLSAGGRAFVQLVREHYA